MSKIKYIETDDINKVKDIPIAAGNMIVVKGAEPGLYYDALDNVRVNMLERLDDMIYEKAGGSATEITLQNVTLKDLYPKTFIATASNGGAPTKINTIPVYKQGTTVAPSITKDRAYTVWYDSTKNAFFLRASAEGDTVASHVLAGDKFSNDIDVGLLGTMPNIGKIIKTLGINETFNIAEGYHNGQGVVSQNIPTIDTAIIKPSTVNQVIKAGQYMKGDQIVLGDPNLLAQHIADSVSIFGVQGSANIKTLGGYTLITGKITTPIKISSTVETGRDTFILVDIPELQNYTKILAIQLYGSIGAAGGRSVGGTYINSIFGVFYNNINSIYLRGRRIDPEYVGYILEEPVWQNIKVFWENFNSKINNVTGDISWSAIVS